MRLAGRIVFVVLSAGVPSAVALLACETTPHLPGLPDELNNHVGGEVPVTSSSSGATTTSSSSGSSGTLDAGPAQSPCDCAVAITEGSQGCVTCQNTSCASALTTCQSAPNNGCSGGTQCVLGCVDDAGVADGGCVTGCLQQFPFYTTFVDCLFSSCSTPCGWSPVVDCALDAGTD